MCESIVALEGAFEIAEKWKNKSNEQVQVYILLNYTLHKLTNQIQDGIV